MDVTTPHYQTPKRYRFVIAGLIGTIMFCVGLSFFSVAPIMPLILEEYTINRGTGSLLTSLVILVQAMFSLVGGLLAGLLRPRKIILIGCILISTPVLTFALGDFWLLLLSRVLMGLGFGILGPATIPILMQYFRPKELPLVNSLLLSISVLGITISSLSVAKISDSIGWEQALSVFGGAALVSTILWLFFGHVKDIQNKEIETNKKIRQAINVIRKKETLILSSADGGAFGQYVALVAWLPTFYFEFHGLSLISSGVLVSLLPLLGCLSGLSAGILSIKYRARKPFLIASGIMVSLGGLGSFLMAGTPLVYPSLILLGAGSWLYVPFLLTIPMELPGNDPARAAMMTGVIFAIGGLVGFSTPLIVGAMTDATGTYLPGFITCSVLSLGLLLGGLLISEPSKVSLNR